MCGIAGFLGPTGSKNELEKIVLRMSETITHRGPNDSGCWTDCDHGIALAHRRLAIMDLSETGHQPMTSESGRFVIIFNGEIYNHLDLRRELLSTSPMLNWRGHSDTETLLAAISTWGVKEALTKCVGMFAFALWDKHTNTLTLARDRLGEKPLYYGWQNGFFLFGSELKALKAHTAFESKINRESLALMMRFGYVPAPHSIWKKIYKLKAGNVLTISRENPEPKLENYWSGISIIKSGLSNQFHGSADESVVKLESILSESIRKQMLADVPLGAFLSGGIDSTTVVALMQAQTSRPVQTFTIGFNEAQYNEAQHAKVVAKHLGTQHTELYVTAQDAMSLIPDLPNYFDEPFGDCSQIPTLILAKLASKEVTVALSGDGGDELFCGYNRYLTVNRLWNKLSLIPSEARQILSYLLTAVNPERWNQISHTFLKALPQQFNVMNLGDKLHKGADVLASKSLDELYINLVSHWKNPEKLVLGVNQSCNLKDLYDIDLSLSGVDGMMTLDMLSYLPDDILVKVDRAAMAYSLETRVPFLDHRVVEFAWSLPLNYKVRENLGKWPLRQILYKHVPKNIMDRPKMGFGVPIGDWLRTSLRNWAEALISETRLQREGFFNATLIRQTWEEHLSGKKNNQALLWNVLMFQSWLEKQNLISSYQQ